jgi:hypothetical protein
MTFDEWFDSEGEEGDALNQSQAWHAALAIHNDPFGDPRKVEIKLTPDEARIFQYEASHVWHAAQKLRECKLTDWQTLLDQLDAKIRILNSRILDTFGELAKEANPG